MTNENISQHNKRTHTHSNIVIIIACLICVICGLCNSSHATGSNPINVEIVGDHNNYQIYDANDYVNNSYIQRTSNRYFVDSWNVLAKNIAKMTSSLSYFTQQYNLTLQPSINTINSNITPLQGLLSTINNTLGTTNGTLAGVRQDIQGTYTYLNKIANDNWTTLSYSPTYLNGSLTEISYTAYQNVGKDMYISTPNNTSIDPNSILHIRLPISYQSNLDHLDIEFTNYRYTEFEVPYYYVIPSMWQVDIYYISPFNAVGSTYIHLHNDYGLRFTDTGISGNPLCQYILPDNVHYKEYVEIMFGYQNHRETIDTLNNNNDEILDAINNLSLVNNDVKINVNVSNNDSQTVQNVIPFVRSFFDNNISLSDFVTESGDVQNNWFSQTNQDIMNSLSGGYVNLYD